MSIGSISNSPQPIQQPRQPEAAERGPDNDGDADDVRKAQAAATQNATAQQQAVQSTPPANRAQMMDIKA